MNVYRSHMNNIVQYINNIVKSGYESTKRREDQGMTSFGNDIQAQH